MKSREISRSEIGPFSLACTDPYIGIGWENQSNENIHEKEDGSYYVGSANKASSVTL